jgi:hypothetical protein
MDIPLAGSAFRAVGLLALATIFVSGCGQKALTAPIFDPETIAQQAMDEYDKNKDGKLDEAELEKCPALRGALAQIAGPDKSYIEQDDLVKRLQKFQKSHTGLSMIACRVTRGGIGVKDVTVTLIPEKFMGGTIKQASGVSNEEGEVKLMVEGESVSGVNLGYYRVEASLKDEQGNELLPPRFNKETVFGREVPNDRTVSVMISFES